MPDVMEYAPFNPEFKANPFPYYARLREEKPIYRTTLADGRPIWLVTRYEDVVAVLRDERFVKDVANALTPEQRAKLPPVPAESLSWRPGMLVRGLDRLPVAF